MVTIKPKMLDAMLHFLIFVIRRDLLAKEEIQIFHSVIFHYLKNLIGRFSGTDTHKTQEIMAKEIRRKIIRKNTRKGTLERGVSNKKGFMAKSKANHSDTMNSKNASIKLSLSRNEQKFVQKILNFLKIYISDSLERKFDSIASE